MRWKILGIWSLLLFGMVGLPKLSAEEVELRASGVKAVVVDNEAWAEHRARYNGLAFLSRGPEHANIFHLRWGGFNLENIYDAEQALQDRTPQPENFLFEPRNIPMKLRRIDDDTVELTQAAGPKWGIENRTRFTVREPYYVDIEFECIPRIKAARGGFFGLFWANYVNAPEDGGYYFLGRREPKEKLEWVRAFSKEHNDHSTFLPEDSSAKIEFAPDYPGYLWNNFSEVRYRYPLYYGIVQGQMFLLMLDSDEEVRFAHSPTGGGGTPAWDFQLVIPDYEVGKSYRLRARVVVKDFANHEKTREDVIAEYEKWSGRKVTRPDTN